MKKPSRADSIFGGIIIFFVVVAWFFQPRPIEWLILFALGGVLVYFDERVSQLQEGRREQIEINSELAEIDDHLNDRINELSEKL